MRAKGRDWKSVLAELHKMKSGDAKYENGAILTSMCTSPYPGAKKAHKLFLDANLGDSSIFPATRQLEKQVVHTLSELLHCPKKTGFIVSGGTEANLLALLSARNIANLEKPEVVIPESGHFSFTKICNLLQVKTVQVPLDKSFRVNISSMERSINKNTIAIVGTAGTAELGAVDPVVKLSDIAHAHGVWLHVDAAFGGLVIPFLDEASRDALTFDFKLTGVKELNVLGVAEKFGR